MYTVTKYNNIKSSEVEAKIGIDEVFKIIKEGDSKLEFIKLARNYEKGSENYDSIKTSIIPTFRFNFLFEGKASNKNITEATGLIFIDIDNLDELPDSDFIYAKWKSISLTGYGVLVKVDGLTQNNFNNIYDEISKLLGVSSDSGARKPTQQTVQSFDPDIYINHDSRVYNCANSKKVPFPIKQKKEKGGLTTNDTFLLVPHINTNVRFNNIDNYFKDNDLHYLVFKEKKEGLCIPYIPKKVEKGNRNRCLFIYLSQIVALNPNINKAYIRVLAGSINLNVMNPQLEKIELSQVIDSIFRLKESNDLKMLYNKERRIIFNPIHKISFKEKMKIVNIELGNMTSERTKEKIYECIEEWDFQLNEKISQKKVASITELSLSTIKRYWSNFKDYAKDLNSDYMASRTTNRIKTSCKIEHSKFYIVSPRLKKSA